MPNEESTRTGKDKGMTEEVMILDDAVASEALRLFDSCQTQQAWMPSYVPRTSPEQQFSGDRRVLRSIKCWCCQELS